MGHLDLGKISMHCAVLGKQHLSDNWLCKLLKLKCMACMYHLERFFALMDFFD